MQKKYFRVEQNKVEIDKIYSTQNYNFGKSFDFQEYQHFLNTYLRVMQKNNISVDFFVTLNNEIYLNGGDYLKNINNSIINEEFIDIYKVTKNNNHKNQIVSINNINQFVQSFDESNPFIFFGNGTYLWEIVTEFVRTNFFPEKPQRLQSLFLFDNLESCHYYIEKHLNGIGNIYEVEIINIDKIHQADMKIIDNIENHILYEDLINQFADYWRGKTTENEIREVIFQGQYKYKNIT